MRSCSQILIISFERYELRYELRGPTLAPTTMYLFQAH
jgi:hypothetical protein